MAASLSGRPTKGESQMNEELGSPMNPWFTDETPPSDPPQTDTQTGKGDRDGKVKPPQKS
jgi:hypothetical protein